MEPRVLDEEGTADIAPIGPCDNPE